MTPKILLLTPFKNLDLCLTALWINHWWMIRINAVNKGKSKCLAKPPFGWAAPVVGLVYPLWQSLTRPALCLYPPLLAKQAVCFVYPPLARPPAVYHHRSPRISFRCSGSFPQIFDWSCDLVVNACDDHHHPLAMNNSIHSRWLRCHIFIPDWSDKLYFIKCLNGANPLVSILYLMVKINTFILHSLKVVDE